MDKDKPKYLLHRRKRALDNKKNWESILQKTYRYSQPNRNIFDSVPMGTLGDTRATHGQNQNWYVFDDTLSYATDVYVNRITNALTPAGKKWLNFVPGSKVKDDFKEEVKKALQKNTSRFFEYINNSNFQLAIGEAYYDMVVSTGFLMINPGFEEDQKIIFDSLPPDRTYADEGPYGTFDAYYRDWVRLPREHAEAMWEGIELPADKNEEYKQENNEFTLFEMVYKCYKKKDWVHCIIEERTQSKVWEFRRKYSPIVGFRAKKLSGETYGRGPAMDAMPAAATINQAMFDEIMAANFKALPIFMGFGDGVFNPETFKIVPNTVMACSPVTSGTWPLQPIPNAGDIQWGNLIIGDLREQIHRRMMTNPFGAVDDPRKTATEIIERQREIAENASASFSRIQRELLKPAVNVIIEIMRENGDWTDPVVDGKVIAVDFETPLVISQGQKEVLDFLQYNEYLHQVFGPEQTPGLYQLNLISPWMADKLNIDLDLIQNSAALSEIFYKANQDQEAMIEAEMNQGQQMQPAQQPVV